MSIYVVEAADIARAEGVTNIKEWDGWQTESASKGGFTELMGVIMHHTASPPSWHGDKDWNYTLTNPDNAPEYLAGIDPDGRLNILCAGGANSSGKGGPVTLSTGTVPQDGANYRLIAVCFGNTGVGDEEYTKAAIDTGVRFVGGLCRYFGWDTGAITAHKEWCGPGTSSAGRKVDPFGPWTGGGDWGPQQGRIDEFRGRVFDYLCVTPPPEPDPEVEMKKVMLIAANDGNARSTAFWYDGEGIGWIPHSPARDAGLDLGWWQFQDNGDYYRNFSQWEIQQLINTCWRGGVVPSPYTRPPS